MFKVSVCYQETVITDEESRKGREKGGEDPRETFSS